MPICSKSLIHEIYRVMKIAKSTHNVGYSVSDRTMFEAFPSILTYRVRVTVFLVSQFKQVSLCNSEALVTECDQQRNPTVLIANQNNYKENASY